MTLNPVPLLSAMSCLLVIINEKQDHTCGCNMPYRWEANVAWFRDLRVVEDVPAFSDNIEVTRRRDVSQLWVITWPHDHELLGVLWMGLKIRLWEKQTNKTLLMSENQKILDAEGWQTDCNCYLKQRKQKNQGSLRNSGPQILRGEIQMSESEPLKKAACKWTSHQRTPPPQKINKKTCKFASPVPLSCSHE